MAFPFLVFVLELVYPKYTAYCFILYMLRKYCDVLKQQKTLRLKSVPLVLFNKLIEENVWDSANTIILNNKANPHHLSFMIVKGPTKKVAHRIVTVVSKSLPYEKDVALISNTLSYNTNFAKFCNLKPTNSEPKYADEVILSLVKTPTEWSDSTIDTCLKNYFQTPKLLCKGDLVVVDIKTHGREVFYKSNKLYNINEKLYFKCSTVICDGRGVKTGCLCAVGKTVVRQSTNIQSFVPQSFNCDEAFEKSCIGGLGVYFERLKKAVSPFLNKASLQFQPIFLLEGKKGSGKSLLIECVASYFGMHLYTISNFDLTANVYAQNETKLRNIFFNVKLAAPCILEIRNFEDFGKNQEGEHDERLISHFAAEVKLLLAKNNFPVIVFCSANEKNLPVTLRRVFLKSFEIKAPSDVEREKMLDAILNGVSGTNSNDLAHKTSGFLFEDLKALVDSGVTEFQREHRGEGAVPESYFFNALENMQSSYNESLGAPRVPQVKWDDVGGLNDVKEEIVKTIKLPLKHPELLRSGGLKRSGILLYGPPGTGKTLLAKAVATECGLCFLSVKGPELLNMYVGQSEQNVREIFERAKDASPCIIFFDELDSLAPNRGASGDSGGVMDRVVSQLLAEMDGLNKAGTIFIIGATNRPDLIDPALLRPGRIDKLLYVGPCVDPASKMAVLKALTRKFHFKDDSVIEKVVKFCPENVSGADFYGICLNAWLSAVRRLIAQRENGLNTSASSPTLKDVLVTADDFMAAIKSAKPSIKQEDMEYFRKLNKTA